MVQEDQAVLQVHVNQYHLNHHFHPMVQKVQVILHFLLDLDLQQGLDHQDYLCLLGILVFLSLPLIQSHQVLLESQPDQVVL